MTTACISYEEWLPRWTAHLSRTEDVIQVPSTATVIITPLQTHIWLQQLSQSETSFLLHIRPTYSFRIGYHSETQLKLAKRNLPCALDHPEVVDQYLAEELSHSRLAGSYHINWASHMHISRFGVIPKHHQPNKWRLIIDLSHPAKHSVNDGILNRLCSLSYITIDSAIGHILNLGQGTLLAKIDVKHAFRLLPIRPADRHLLAMRWKNIIFVDTCLPIGLRSAPKLFNILADLLSWILEQQGVSPLLQYLDDFLLMAPPQSSQCQDNLLIVQHICSLLGIPLALENVEGPTDSLTFLGITLDTKRMEARLPSEKLNRIHT